MLNGVKLMLRILRFEKLGFVLKLDAEVWPKLQQRAIIREL